MTGKITNLRQARKQAERARDKAAADENAARHGQSKAARVFAAAQGDKARRLLDQHRLDEEE